MMPWLVREMQRGIERELCDQGYPRFNCEGGLNNCPTLFYCANYKEDAPGFDWVLGGGSL